MAVLENNLIEAVGRADMINGASIAAIVGYCYNELPRDCWQSPAAVKAWLDDAEYIEVSE
jgi:hypothetical protein